MKLINNVMSTISRSSLKSDSIQNMWTGKITPEVQPAWEGRAADVGELLRQVSQEQVLKHYQQLSLAHLELLGYSWVTKTFLLLLYSLQKVLCNLRTSLKRESCYFISNYIGFWNCWTMNIYFKITFKIWIFLWFYWLLRLGLTN